MKIAFRTDASLQIGSGHVMRCLTLADALRAQGSLCHFICREHPGHLLEVVRQRGHHVSALPAVRAVTTNACTPATHPSHADWLGCNWQADAQETGAVLDRLQPDWLVADHYALDQRWEESLATHFRYLLAIDDLADRPHACNLLLDQNLGRQPHDYAGLVPATCRLLTGPRYALLRPEFAALRAYSLQRRQAQSALRQVLVTMGGVDKPNATGQVLDALRHCALPKACHITVVMGLTAPWLQDVQEVAAQMPWPTEVVVNISNMAQRMADSDLAIGAAGSTSWERCCLGLPTLMVALVENQKDAAEQLQKMGAADTFVLSALLPADLQEQLQSFVLGPQRIIQMSVCASRVTNGLGVESVLAAMAVSLKQEI